MNPVLQENRMDYMQLLLIHGKRNTYHDTSGTETEDGEDDELRKGNRELNEKAKAKEMTMEVEKI